LAASDYSNTGKPPAEGAQGDAAADVIAASRRPQGARRFGLFVLAFGSGFAVLTIEIAGARLIAPVFGFSAVPWTAVIGVILAALAVGSHLGGRLADQRRIPLSAVLVAAALTGALPVVGASIPWMAREFMGFIGGALTSALILFAPAVLCLGAVVPYLVKADTESLGNVGRRAGDVSAAATAGSIAGTFTTGFVLLPAFPLPVLLGLTAAGLLVMAGLSGWILGKRVSTVFIALGAIGLATLGVASAQRPADTLHQEQTLYASVRVTERDWGDGRLVRELWQNGASSSAEYVDTGNPAHWYVAASGLILEPVMDDVESMLVLGGAALSLPVAFSRWKPQVRIDVVEIDPVVTEMAAEYFAYGRAEYPNIHVLHEDARVYVRDGGELYDLIYLDVSDHLLTVPWTMVTVEAFRDMANRLKPDGLFVANVLSPLSGPGVGFLQRLRATAVEVFEEVQVYVTDSEVDPAAIQNLIMVASRDAFAVPRLDWPVAGPGAAGRPLRDAWAPVEYLQARIFLQGIRWN
jgi:predicted membrane-bound spermidine synthase